MSEIEDPEGSMVPWIELQDGRKVQLTGDCRIGRSATNEIVIVDPRISRQNSIVQRQGAHFVVVDLGSTNGTYLNGSRIYKPARLSDGDVITVGSERYTFRKPVDEGGALTDAGESRMFMTEVAVGKSNCWMVVVIPPNAADPEALAWIEQMRQSLLKDRTGVKRLPGESLFVHWREGRGAQEKARAFIQEFSGKARLPGAKLAGHYGAVRVGSSANISEENLLGPDVTFTHQLAKAVAKLDAEIVLSEAASRSLGLDSTARPLGPQTVGELPGTHPLFVL